MIHFLFALLLNVNVVAAPPAEPLPEVQLAEFETVVNYLISLPPPPPPEPPAPPVVEEPAPVITTAPTGDSFLDCVRNRESGGNYSIYNSGGSGAAGAYQFMPGTWDSIAASSGRGDLVGVDPAMASPEDQDAMAAALYAQQGAAPWGGGC